MLPFKKLQTKREPVKWHFLRRRGTGRISVEKKADWSLAYLETQVLETFYSRYVPNPIVSLSEQNFCS